MKSQHKTKSKKRKASGVVSDGSEDAGNGVGTSAASAAKPEGGAAPLKLVLRLSASGDNGGEKRWTIGGGTGKEEETEQPEKLPPIRIKIRGGGEPSAEALAPDVRLHTGKHSGLKRRSSPRRNIEYDEDSGDGAAQDGDDGSPTKAGQRISTRVRKSTETNEFLFEPTSTTARSKRKREGLAPAASSDSEPLRRLSKRVRQSLPAEGAEQSTDGEADVGSLQEIKPASSEPPKKKKKLTLRKRKPSRTSDIGPDGEPLQKRLLPLKKVLTIILAKLIRKDGYGVFYNPVTEEEAPDYFSIIKHPMDFSTMRTNLNSGKYPTLDAFYTDLLQICNNAKTYNQPGTLYYQEAQALQDFGEELKQLYAPKVDMTPRVRSAKSKSGAPKTPTSPAAEVVPNGTDRATRSRSRSKSPVPGEGGAAAKGEGGAAEKESDTPRKKRAAPKPGTPTDASAVPTGNAFSLSLQVPEAQTPEKPRRRGTGRGTTPRKRNATPSSTLLSGANNPLAFTPMSYTNMYMPTPTTHSMAYSVFKQQQPPSQPPAQQPSQTPTLTGFINSLPARAVPQVKSSIGSLTTATPTPITTPTPASTTTQLVKTLGLSTHVLNELKTLDATPPSKSQLDKAALDGLASLAKEGFDISFLQNLQTDVLLGEAQQPQSQPQPQPQQPQQEAKPVKPGDNIQTHLAGLSPDSIPPSDDSIQAMLNKNAELLLNLQLSQYERSTPTLTEKESRMATQLCESLTALSSKVTPRDVASSNAPVQAMASRVQRLGVPPVPVQQPAAVATTQGHVAAPQQRPATAPVKPSSASSVSSASLFAGTVSPAPVRLSLPPSNPTGGLAEVEAK